MRMKKGERTTLPSPDPISMRGEMKEKGMRERATDTFSSCQGVAGTKGMQTRRSAGVKKGRARSDTPTAVPPTTPARIAPVLLPILPGVT